MFNFKLPSIPSFLQVKLMLLRNKKIILPIVFLLLSIFVFFFMTRENFASVTGKEFIFVTMPGCQFCEKSKPEWELFVKNYGGNQFANLKTISTETDPIDVEKWGVSSFPSYLYVKNGKLIKNFEGSKSYQELQKVFDTVIGDNSD